jgi:beta-carotene 3-hydroxylase
VGIKRDVVTALAAFAVMEPVAYATHRWVMHGVGWGWHASHHAARPGTFERNDLYPVTFASATIVATAVASQRRWRPVLAVAAGVTAYGAAYSVVHEIYAHRRAPSLRRPSAPLELLGTRHMRHHRRGGEPFGMLAPLVVDVVTAGAGPSPGRQRAATQASPAPVDPFVEVGALGADGGVVPVSR